MCSVLCAISLALLGKLNDILLFWDGSKGEKFFAAQKDYSWLCTRGSRLVVLSGPYGVMD